MKKSHSRVASFFVVFALLCSLCCIDVFAWTYFQDQEDYTEGEYVDEYITCPNSQQIDDIYLSSGSLPDGISYSSYNEFIRFYGTPSKAGCYDAEIACRTNDTDYICQVRFYVVEKVNKTRYVSGKFYGKAGKYSSETEVVYLGTVINSYTTSGSLPTGMNLVVGDTYISYEGTPTAPGNYYLDVYCQTASETVVAQITAYIEYGQLTVTKSPSGESVTEHQSALFISDAENYSDFEWRVVTPDGSNCWRNKNEIESGFPGVSVYTYQEDSGRQCLVLSNIPYSMNGYYIQTKFWSMDKTQTAFTSEKSCQLSVKKEDLKPPVIATNPYNIEKTIGENATLSVTANDPNNGTLKYQWYSNTINSTSGGTPVNGANSYTFNPPQNIGTKYYYVAITSEKEGRLSAATYSTPAVVTYKAQVTPSPTPTTAPAVTQNPSAAVIPTPSPVVQPSQVTAAPTPGIDTPVPTQTPARGRNTTSSLLNILIIVLVVLLLALVVVYFILGAKKKKSAVSKKRNYWICDECGEKNQGKFCQYCGTRKPVHEHQYACDKCGWEPDDPTKPPKFCPECGDPFGAEDIID